MIKSELVQRMANRNPHLYHRDLERIACSADKLVSSGKRTRRGRRLRSCSNRVAWHPILRRPTRWGGALQVRECAACGSVPRRV